MSIQLYSSPMKYKDPNTGNYIDIIGISGNPGRGISSVELNNDYTLTITFTDGTSTTINSIRGAQGVGIRSVEKTNTSGLVDTYTITFDDNTISTFQVTNGASIDLHICAQGEYDSTTRVPTIQNPDSRTFYLVPNEDSGASNAYTEWLYANGAWERFGAQVIDLSGYATKADTVLETTLSRGRKEGSIVGERSFAFGNEVEASSDCAHAEGSSTLANGFSAHAEGQGTKASGPVSHAEGFGSIASGLCSHAENGINAVGFETIASGMSSHAEGCATKANGMSSHSEGWKTNANGVHSHAEGLNTIANAKDSHAGGKYNIADSYDNWPEWVSETSYTVGDKVKVTTVENNETVVKGYICKTANNDTTFTASKWTADDYINYARIIGNGASDAARSNAYALDWDGNGHYMGDVYVGANADSSGGTKVATVDDIAAIEVPVNDVQVNSVSIVENGVANIPVAGGFDFGVVKIINALGIDILSNGALTLTLISNNDVKRGTVISKAITPSVQHTSVFYGLSKVAGVDLANETVTLGTYPETSKAAIKSMLGVQDGLKVVRLI